MPSITFHLKEPSLKRIIIVGGGVGGKEVGTYLGQQARRPIEIIEIEREPARAFGGYGFQNFPSSESTNLAMRKMYLGQDPNEIIAWSTDPRARAEWPAELRSIELHPDQPFPRALMKKYVEWRRSRVSSDLVTYRSETGEAVRVSMTGDGVEVLLEDGRTIQGDQLVMATGSLSVKIPAYLKPLVCHANVIVDPLIVDGHERRALIPPGSRVLVLGTGLTGEEQAKILLGQGVTDIMMVSREGRRHHAYPAYQKNVPLAITACPEFFSNVVTSEEFNRSLEAFYAPYLERGYTPEDILEAVRPWWGMMREKMGGEEKAAEYLHQFKRPLATHSIGTSWEVRQKVREAEARGQLRVMGASIREIVEENGRLKVSFNASKDGSLLNDERYDYIINAVGRNIIQHPIWERMLKDGLASKHLGIGVRVNEYGQLIDPSGHASSCISVVGMARSGDHALRRGYLGNTAFNVPQVRAHAYETAKAVLALTEK